MKGVLQKFSREEINKICKIIKLDIIDKYINMLKKTEIIRLNKVDDMNSEKKIL